MTKGMSLEEEMNMVLNQYDKSMFIKNEQGIVDVTNPENVQKMALLLKRDHPELYRRLEMEIGSQNNILEDLSVLKSNLLTIKNPTQLRKELLQYIDNVKEMPLDSLGYEHLTNTIKEFMLFSNRIAYHCKLILDKDLSSFRSMVN